MWMWSMSVAQHRCSTTVTQTQLFPSWLLPGRGRVSVFQEGPASFTRRTTPLMSDRWTSGRGWVRTFRRGCSGVPSWGWSSRASWSLTSRCRRTHWSESMGGRGLLQPTLRWDLSKKQSYTVIQYLLSPVSYPQGFSLISWYDVSSVALWTLWKGSPFAALQTSSSLLISIVLVVYLHKCCQRLKPMFICL